MKIDNLTDIKGLLEVVNSCHGQVEMVTGEGDRLNLKSKLCQLIAISTIFPQITQLPDLEIFAHEPDDMEKLAKFLFG